MKCSVCSTETDVDVCPTCGHHVSGIDATNRFTVEPPTSELPAVTRLEDVPAGHAALIVIKGAQAGELWTLDSPEIEVGRVESCGLFLDDITVSRHHAFFRRTESGWSIEDQGSLNGTYVNRGLATGKTALHSGDEVQIGKFRFTFHEGHS